MLDFSLIRDFLERVDIESSDFVVKENANKDFIEAFCPDMDFRECFNKIYNYRPYYVEMVDNGDNFIEVRQDTYIGEYKVNLSYLVTIDDFKTGVIVRVITKRVTAVINGDIKVFLGFSALDEYLEKFA